MLGLLILMAALAYLLIYSGITGNSVKAQIQKAFSGG